MKKVSRVHQSRDSVNADCRQCDHGERCCKLVHPRKIRTNQLSQTLPKFNVCCFRVNDNALLTTDHASVTAMAAINCFVHTYFRIFPNFFYEYSEPTSGCTMRWLLCHMRSFEHPKQPAPKICGSRYKNFLGGVQLKRIVCLGKSELTLHSDIKTCSANKICSLVATMT